MSELKCKLCEMPLETADQLHYIGDYVTYLIKNNNALQARIDELEIENGKLKATIIIDEHLLAESESL